MLSQVSESNHKKAPSIEGAVDTNLNWRSTEGRDRTNQTKVASSSVVVGEDVGTSCSFEDTALKGCSTATAEEDCGLG